MGIVSGIFWILLGIGYIIYRLAKDHPGEAVLGAKIYLLVMGAIAAFMCTLTWLLEANATVGIVFGIIGIVAIISLCAYGLIPNKKERHDREIARRALEIVKQETYAIEEVKEHYKNRPVSCVPMCFVRTIVDTDDYKTVVYRYDRYIELIRKFHEEEKEAAEAAAAQQDADQEDQNSLSVGASEKGRD